MLKPYLTLPLLSLLSQGNLIIFSRNCLILSTFMTSVNIVECCQLSTYMNFVCRPYWLLSISFSETEFDLSFKVFFPNQSFFFADGHLCIANKPLNAINIQWMGRHRHADLFQSVVAFHISSVRSNSMRRFFHILSLLSINPAVLKLGVATLLRVANF